MTDDIVWNEIDVDNALDIMDLHRVGFARAIGLAEYEPSRCTANDALGFARFLIYDKLGRGLREQYLPSGKWVKDDSDNQVAIRNLDKGIRIVPCNFNEFAGNRLVTPTNHSPKGEISGKRSACNRTALLPGIPDIDPEANDGFITWLLGAYINEERTTGAELSCPVAFDGRFFTLFSRRIILQSGEDAPRIERRDDRSDEFGVVDIAVTPKT